MKCDKSVISCTRCRLDLQRWWEPLGNFLNKGYWLCECLPVDRIGTKYLPRSGVQLELWSSPQLTLIVCRCSCGFLVFLSFWRSDCSWNDWHGEVIAMGWQTQGRGQLDVRHGMSVHSQCRSTTSMQRLLCPVLWSLEICRLAFPKLFCCFSSKSIQIIPNIETSQAQFPRRKRCLNNFLWKTAYHNQKIKI